MESFVVKQPRSGLASNPILGIHGHGCIFLIIRPGSREIRICLGGIRNFPVDEVGGNHCTVHYWGKLSFLRETLSSVQSTTGAR